MVKRIIPIFGLDSSILTPKQAQIYQELCASPISYLKDYKNKAIIKKLQEMNYIQIQDEEINTLFSDLSSYTVKSINEIKYDLETYFDTLFLKKEAQ